MTIKLNMYNVNISENVEYRVSHTIILRVVVKIENNLETTRFDFIKIT